MKVLIAFFVVVFILSLRSTRSEGKARRLPLLVACVLLAVALSSHRLV